MGDRFPSLKFYGIILKKRSYINKYETALLFTSAALFVSAMTSQHALTALQGFMVGVSVVYCTLNLDLSLHLFFRDVSSNYESHGSDSELGKFCIQLAGCYYQ